MKIKHYFSEMSACRGALASKAYKPIHRWWTEFIFVDLTIACIAGFVYAVLIMGMRPLHPSDVSWLPQDGATAHIGWELFRQDPHLHWPFMYTERLGYPLGDSAALMDTNTLLAVIFKPLSPLLPEPFQYMGLEVVLACILQYFFALRLFRLLIPGASTLTLGSSSLFFLLSPPLTLRVAGHFALTNHWIILAALLIFCRAQCVHEKEIRAFNAAGTALTVISTLINPYLAFQACCLLCAGTASLLWQGKMTLLRALGSLTLFAATCIGTAVSFGIMILGSGNASTGYRDFSMNLLSPLDPGRFSSFFPGLPTAANGQYEGYNYLGAGVIVLGVLIVLISLFQHKGHALKASRIIPLLFCCGLLTILAASTKVTAGSMTVVDWDKREALTPYLAVFRASGRLFWLPYYLILTGILVILFRSVSESSATLLIATALICQFADTAKLRHEVYTAVNESQPQPLKSHVWSALGHVYQDLIVLPAWQCGSPTPGDGDGYRIFGFLAVAEKMRINSYYSARHTDRSTDIHCSESLESVVERPLSPTSAYIVTPEIATLISEGPTGPGKCHDLDTFILCSSSDGLGLDPVLLHPAVRLEHALINSSFESGNLGGWRAFGKITAGVDASHVHSGLRALAQSSGYGSLYQDVSGLQPNHIYAVTAWVSGSPDATASAEMAISADGSTFSQPVPLRPAWRLLTHFTAARHPSTIRVHLFRGPGTGTVYWDDVSIFERK